MLVITGTQRSGTTLVASLFVREGYSMGISNMDEVGGHENQTICSFYRDYLGDATFPYDDFPHERDPVLGTDKPFTHLAGLFAFLELPVVKFSYLGMNPAFVSIWHKFRPAASYKDKFLILKRNPMHVVRSKKIRRERFSHDSLLIQQSAASIDNNLDMSIALLDELGYQYVVVPFEDLISRFCINEYLAVLKVGIRIPRETWDYIFIPEKINFR